MTSHSKLIFDPGDPFPEPDATRQIGTTALPPKCVAVADPSQRCEQKP